MSTAREVLEGALRDYRKAEAELAQYRSKVEKAQREAQGAIDNSEISEGVASAKLALSQVLEARLKSRESARNRLIGELGTAVTLAGQELNNAVRQAWLSRLAVIGRRGVEAMQLDAKILDQGLLDEALSFSPLLVSIRELEVAVYVPAYIERITQDPAPMLRTDDDNLKHVELTMDRHAKLTQELDSRHLLGAAEQIIEHFQKLAAEMERAV
jgi:hypothetical protein